MTNPNLPTIDLDGVNFLPLPGWSREVEHTEEGVFCSMQSSGVSFALVGLYPVDRDPDDLLEQALDALRQEHPSLEADDWDESDPEDPIQTIEAVFMSLDTVAYCWLRAWKVGARTVVVMVQSVEPEAERGRLAFRALCQSMKPAGELPSAEAAETTQRANGKQARRRTAGSKEAK